MLIQANYLAPRHMPRLVAMSADVASLAKVAYEKATAMAVNPVEKIEVCVASMP